MTHALGAINDRAGGVAAPTVGVGEAFLSLCPTCRHPARTCTCLWDVRDPSAFVHATINRFSKATANRGPISLSQDEHEELHAEGMAILYRLSVIFDPHREGYAQPGRFSGFAAQNLPRKLGDAWHRMHAEHTLVAQPEGGRRWHYGERAVSLEAMTAEDPDRHSVMASNRRETDVRGRLKAALDGWWERQRDVILDVGDVFAQGGTTQDAQQMLGLTSEQVNAAVGYISRIADRLQEGDGE